MADMEMTKRRFPLTYEEAKDHWEGRLSSEYRLCETGCGLNAVVQHILCADCLARFRESVASLTPAERLEWMDAQRRKHLPVAGDQATMWMRW